jgi:YVTN family beta-propeller protein
MKLRKFFWLSLCFLTVWTITACSEDNGGIDNGGGDIEDVDPSERIFILYEGNMNGNDAGMDMYSPTGGENEASLFIGNVYMSQNGEGLGDTGQDMIAHGDYLYASITGSYILVKMTDAAKKVATVHFDADDGQPRYLAAKDGKVYVTLYGGYVAKIDAATFQIEGKVRVGSNPEGIVECDGKLYVCNSGWGYDNTLSVIDLATFEVEKTVEVAANPNEIVASEGKIFVMSYGAAYPDPFDYQVQMYDPATEEVTRLANATKLAEYNGKVFIVYSDTDWNTYTTTNTFATYDVQKNELVTGPFLSEMPDALNKNAIYMLDIDPRNGDFYLSVSDYVSNGTIYRFNNEGKLIDTMNSYGLNPTKTVFVD